MTTEFFPPTEEELETMISETENKMERAQSQDEWLEYLNRLQELKDQLQQLIIQNNAL